VCTGCPLGTASEAVGAINDTVCEPCTEGFYSAGVGAPVCSSCSPTGCTTEQGCHWTSDAATFESCSCFGDWVGSDCEVLSCSDVLSGISMASLLFHADFVLRRYSDTFNITAEQPKDAYVYLRDLVNVQIDVNGDGVVTREELLNLLFVRSVRSANMSIALPLWCENADVPSSNCAWDGIFAIDLLDQAYINFMTSSEHTFDGSGTFAVSNMASTYPNPDWSDEECASYDSFQTPNEYNRVTTSWDLDILADYTLKQVCGFVNGLASAEFTTTELLSGTATSFTDFVPVSADYGFKRVYCLALQYCRNDLCESGQILTKYECSVGLFFVSSECLTDIIAYVTCFLSGWHSH
jgi:hypothetical protein